MKIGFSYARISTDSNKQGEGVSIEAQHSYNEIYAKSKQIKIQKHFSDRGKTGRNFNRPMINQLKADVKKAIELGFEVVVFIYDTSRFGRDVVGNLQFKREIQKVGAELVITSENLNATDSENFFMFGLKSLLAEQESMNISKRTKNSLRQISEMGYWSKSMLPFGYDKIQIDKRKTGKPNMDGWKLQKVFLEYLNSSTTRNHLRKYYFPQMPKNTFYELFHLRRLIFYSGRLPIPFKNKFQKIVKGKHDGIISVEQCDAIHQKVQFENRTNKGKSFITESDFSELFYLKGFLVNPKNGKPFTSSTTTKNKRTSFYHYYKDQDSSLSIPIHKAHFVFEKALSELVISDEEYKELTEMVKEEMNEQRAEQLKQRKLLVSNILSYQDKIESLDLNFDQYTPSTYERLRVQLQDAITKSESELQSIDKILSKQDDTMLEVLRTVKNISNIFHFADYEHKRRIVEGIFGDVIAIDVKNQIVQTPFLNPTIVSMCSKTDSYEHIKTVQDAFWASSTVLGANSDNFQTVCLQLAYRIAS